MITLIRNGKVFAPNPKKKKDILILGDKIGAISSPGKIKISGLKIKTIDASQKIITPGFIDSHVHILGGGGEGGPSTRAPEITLEEIISSGVSTVIGCLGTDGTTRHLESLLAKARALEEEGITSYIFSGSYQIPVITITNNIISDLIVIDKVIGVGEIAISDHRSSQPTFEEIAKIAAACRVGGLLSGKAGILHLHVGDGPRKLELLFRLLKETEIPATQFIPTHANRNRQLLEEAILFSQQGGYIDLTASLDPEPKIKKEQSIAEAIKLCLEKKAPLSHITISSDGNGSLPVFDGHGNLTGLTVASQKSLLSNFKYLIRKKILSLDQALTLFSTNPASFYKLATKGEIKEGKDADLLVFDRQLNISDFLVKGKVMIADSKLIARSTFSPPK